MKEYVVAFTTTGTFTTTDVAIVQADDRDVLEHNIRLVLEDMCVDNDDITHIIKYKQYAIWEASAVSLTELLNKEYGE